jgi:hypothetical protein|tara:strand:- start:108 stop:326 length:219 start_codon:yes stop_codon:yes gene_type:complete
MKKVIAEKIEVNSQAIEYITYNYILETLKVTFQHGKEYIYFSVDNDTFFSMKNSESIGKFFNKNIKNHFKFS